MNDSGHSATMKRRFSEGCENPAGIMTFPVLSVVVNLSSCPGSSNAILMDGFFDSMSLM